MGTRREKALWRLLKRRVRSSRGSVYLELAVIIPVFLLTFAFAADFTRILYVEQQLEIGSRLLCDIESHLKPGARDHNGKGSGCPGRIGKLAVRAYLTEALANEGLVEQAGYLGNSVYCRGSYYTQAGLIHTAIDFISEKMMGDPKISNAFVRMMQRVFAKAVDFFTMGTYRYLTDVFPTDKGVKTSVSVIIKPFAPKWLYTVFGRHTSDGKMLIAPFAPRLEGGIANFKRPISKTERVRYYCHLPSLDTAPVAPATFVRKLKTIFGAWMK